MCSVFSAGGTVGTWARLCSPRPLTTASLRAASREVGASCSSAPRAPSSQAPMDTTATPTVSDCRSSFSVPFLQLSAAAGNDPFLQQKNRSIVDCTDPAPWNIKAASPSCSSPLPRVETRNCSTQC